MGAVRQPRIARETTASADEITPFHPEAEQCCIGAMLLDPSIIADVFEIVCPEDFFRDAHQSILRTMLALFRRAAAIDVVTLCDELGKTNSYENAGGDDYLHEVIDKVPHAANGRYYACIVRDVAIRRELYELNKTSMSDIARNVRNGIDQLEWLTKALSSIGRSSAIDEELTAHPLPTAMADAAFRGLAGELVRRIKPETEACSEAILAQFLAAFGNVIGPRPRFMVGTTVHRCNLFICLAGPTGIARKGTAWDVARWILEKCDPIWGANPTPSGMTSGEGLISMCRDAGGDGIVFVETEFSKVLTNMNRDGNSLSATLRQLWDSRYAYVPTKNQPLSVDNAFLSVIGHVTIDDLEEYLTAVSMGNGLVNRFAWFNTYRDGDLPNGGDFDSILDAVDPLISSVAFTIEFAKLNRAFDHPCKRSVEAGELWAQIYRGPLARTKTGNYAKATVRAAPIIMRLALIYAVLDRSNVIEVPHLESAMAVWQYCDATAAHIFGNPLHDGNMARIIACLEEKPEWMTRTEISQRTFGGHLPASQLDQLLAQAQGAGDILYKVEKSGGRDRHSWLHKKHVDLAKKAKKAHKSTDHCYERSYDDDALRKVRKNSALAPIVKITVFTIPLCALVSHFAQGGAFANPFAGTFCE